MKTRALLSFLTMFAGCTLAFAQSKFVPEDDIYYQPNETNKIVESKKAASQEYNSGRQIVSESYPVSKNRTRDVDEYNRRYIPENLEETAMQVLDTLSEGSRMIYENPEQGYYLNGFNGNNSDYQYAERIRKFHNPKFTVHFSDPSFNDIYFLSPMDWNVYIDDNYAWVTPTWTNSWYSNYMWSPYSYSSLSWRWNWGWNSWGWNSWGPSWGWGGCYDPFWGPSWGHHHHHHYPNWGHGNHYPNWGHRPSYRPGNVNGTSPRNPYYGNSNSNSGNRRPGAAGNTRPGANVRPGTGDRNDQNISTRPGNNNGNTNIRPGNSRPGNIRPGTTRPSTGATNVRPGATTRPSTGATNVRPGATTRPATGGQSVGRPDNGSNGSVTRPSGNYTRPSRENGNSSNNSYSRPSTSSPSRENSRPSYNSDRSSGSSNSYGGGRSSGGSSSSGSGGGGGRGGRR